MKPQISWELVADPKGTMEHAFGTTDILHKHNLCILTMVFDGDQALQNIGLWLWTDDECLKSLVQINMLKQM